MLEPHPGFFLVLKKHMSCSFEARQVSHLLLEADPVTKAVPVVSLGPAGQADAEARAPLKAAMLPGGWDYMAL